VTLAVRIALVAVAAACALWFAAELRPVRDRQAALAIVAQPRLTPAQLDRAEALLTRAAAHTRSTEPDLRLAQLLAFEHQPERAMRIAQGIVEREPRNFDAWLLLSQTARPVDPALAARAAQRYRQLSPPVPEAR
jgi:plasmid stability protein